MLIMRYAKENIFMVVSSPGKGSTLDDISHTLQKMFELTLESSVTVYMIY